MERIVAENWSILVSAPVAFVAALCLGAVAGWVVVGLIYNQRLTHYQELIVNYRDVLDDKLPVRALRPFPIKRSRQMSFGLILIFVGIGTALIGALVVTSDRSPSPSAPAPKTATAAPTAPALATPALPAAPAPPSTREFTDRTPRELLAQYDGRTPLQADPLIEPFKGKWIKASGKILNLIPDGIPDASIAVLKDGDRTIECRLGPQWSSKVVKLNKDDVLAVIGKIAPHQNGSQLYLLECEIASAEQLKPFSQRDVQKLLEALDEASRYGEATIGPTIGSINNWAVNWRVVLRNQNAIVTYTQCRESLKSEVWDKIDTLLAKHSKYDAQLQAAFALELPAAKNQLSNALQEVIEALQRLPIDSPPAMDDLVAPQFKGLIKQAALSWQWWIEAKQRISEMTSNLKNRGVAEYAK